MRAGWTKLALAGCLVAAHAGTAAPRVWIADQGDNQGNNNRILEIDPVNRRNPPDSQGDAIILNTVPSPAVTFLDELAFDDRQRLWCVVKDAPSQDPDGAKLIDPLLNPANVLRTIRPMFPGESSGGILEGLAFDGSGLWLSAVRQNLSGNLLTRVSPETGLRIAPFDSGTLGAAGKVSIPGTVAQGLLFEPPAGGRVQGYLWHSDVQARKIWKLDLARLHDTDPANDSDLAVAEFAVPFGPKGMDWMGGKIWVASPRDGIWEFDPATGQSTKLFSTPQWNLDGVAILNPSAPVILSDRYEIALAVWIGENAAPTAFTLRNGGPGTMNYTISSNRAWVGVSPNTGSCEGEPDQIALTFQTAGLQAGVYAAELAVGSPEATNAPHVIQVRLTVQTVAPDLDGDADVDQEDFGRLQSCYSGEGVAVATTCAAADLDRDSDADVADFQIFVGCFGRPGQPATRGCDGR